MNESATRPTWGERGRTAFWWVSAFAVYLIIVQVLGFAAAPFVLRYGVLEQGVTAEVAQILRWTFLVAVLCLPALVVARVARWGRERSSKRGLIQRVKAFRARQKAHWIQARQSRR